MGGEHNGTPDPLEAAPTRMQPRGPEQTGEDPRWGSGLQILLNQEPRTLKDDVSTEVYDNNSLWEMEALERPRAAGDDD